MADVLAGETAHQHHAPISHGQSLAISKHLQEQITKLHGLISSLSEEVGQNNSGVAGLQKSVDGTNAAVHALQDGLAGTNHGLDLTRNDLGRTNGSIQKLQQGFQRSSENISALSEGQKVSSTQIEKVQQEAIQTQALAKHLQDTIEKRIQVELASLNDSLSKTNLQVHQLRADEDKTKMDLHEQRDALRGVDAIAKGIRDDLNKTNTVVNIVEHRLGDTTASLKKSQQNLEDLNEIAVKLHESHEKTRSHVQELQGSVKQMNTGDVKESRESLAKLAAAHGATAGRLADAMSALERLRMEKDEHRNQINALRQGLNMSASHLQSLRGELQDNVRTTAAVRDGLKETSSLLLPNIHLDSAEARQSSMRHGTLLHTAVLTDKTLSIVKPSPRGAAGKANAVAAAGAPLAWT